MTINEICNILKKELLDNNYKYGFTVNGTKYMPNINNGFDEEYYNLSMTIYVVQKPVTTMKEKIGTCVDSCMVMRYILNKHNISNKIWLLHNKQRNKVHTILTFNFDNKVVYLELTPQSTKPNYGKEIIYNNEEDLLLEYKNNGIEIENVTDRIVVGEQPHFLLEKIS